MVKSSMDQLKESQGKYRTLVENSLDGICILQDDKIQFANEKLQEITGYTVAELNQIDFWELVVPEMRDLVRDRAMKRLRGDPVTERYEIQALTKDGRVIDLEILATPTDYQGRRATQGCVRDITENKRLREKLAALYRLGSELSLSLDLDQICDRVLKIVSEVLDFDNCAIMLLNDETNELNISAQMGYPADVGGITIPLAGDKGLTAEVARTGRPIYVPDVTRDGRYVQGIPEARSELAVPLAVKNRVIGVLNVESAEVDAFGEQDMQLLGTLGYHTSIAIQTSSLFEKVTQKALELSAVIEIAKALTSSVDIEVLKPTVLDELKKAIPYDLGVLYLYDKKEKRLVMGAQKGFSPEEARERELTALERHPGMVFTAKTPLLVRNVAKEPKVQYSENMRKPASLLYVPLIFQDKSLGAIGLASFEKNHFDEKDLSLSTAIASEVAIAIENARLVKDLATAKVNLQKLNEDLERKVVQRTKALQEAQGKLVRKEKLATLGQLAGSVAHELRNPLAVIRNSLYCTNHRLTQPDPKIRRHLQIIDEQVSRADGIIEDLLDYSKTKVAKKKEVALNKFATKVFGNLSIPNNIKVAMKLSNSLPGIRLDEEQIGRLIANLVKNAVESMPQGGELLLESGMHNGHPVLRIADTGSGIPDKDLKEIFQPLFTTKARGIGLGLALGKSLARANGIAIEVRSRVGEGSTFSLIFGDQSLLASEAGGKS
jgi:PAS domain S-box-containing protein